MKRLLGISGVVFIAAVAGLLLLAMGRAFSAAGTTERVSIASDGTQANYGSSCPSTSADGRYVAFLSTASNLVPSDTNGCYDAFVRDRATGMTERVSVSSTGAQASSHSWHLSISADGRYVALESYASNLVPSDTNGYSDVFVRDRVAGTTERVSVSSDGAQANGNHSHRPSISADGRYVAFYSGATNLVPSDTNGWPDIFVRDRTSGTTERVSVSSTGAQGNGGSYDPSISADGRYVAFGSYASNLVPGDTTGMSDIFLRDRIASTTERVSVSSAGAQANSHSEWPSISADGRFVAFYSRASNLVPSDTLGYSDIFVRDRIAGTTERVSVSSDGTQGNSDSSYPSISADGRYVAFYSEASNLVPGDTNGKIDVFVRDRTAGTTERVSIASDGTQGNSDSYVPKISADGRYVAFGSNAFNLVPGDTNGYCDIFVRDRGAAAPTPSPTPTATPTPSPTPTPVPTSVVPVILVHGLCSNAADCWEASDGVNFTRALTETGFTVETLELMPKPANDDIKKEYAKQLKDKVAAVMRRYRATQVDIVGHSMGGLVARSYLRTYYRDGGSPVRKLIMLGTPNHGSPLLEHQNLRLLFGWLVCPGALSLGDAGKQMTPHDTFLKELNWGGAERGTDWVPSGVSHTTIAGTAGWAASEGILPFLAMETQRLTGDAKNDGVVHRGSVHLDGVPGPCEYSVDHLRLNKANWVVTDVIHVLKGEGFYCFTSGAPLALAEGEAPITSTASGPTITGVLLPSGVAEHRFSVDGTISRTMFLAAVETGTITMTLRTPDGITIDPATISPTVEYFGSDIAPSFHAYAVPSPQPGQWVVRMAAVSVPTTGTFYQLMSLFETNLTMSAGPDKSQYRPGEAAVITATLRRASAPFLGAVVTATVDGPVRVSVFSLHDDGSHGDAVPNDGIYTAIFTGTEGTGGYDLIVAATGQVEGRPFAREDSTRFWVESLGRVGGVVQLQGRSDQRGAVVAVGDNEAGPARDGTYTITLVPAGTYVVTATMPGYLYAVRTGVVVTTGETTVLPTVTLRAGDANGDGQVNIADFGLLAASYLKTSGSPGYNAVVDFNMSGQVNIADFGLLASNYLRTAPRPWP